MTKAMKNSGIEWIGQIPENWKVSKIGSIYNERRTKVSDKDYQPLSVTKKGILPQLENVAKSDDSDNRKLVKSGDFVINSRSDRRGSCGIAQQDGSVSLINSVLQPKSNMNNGYYNFVFKSKMFADEFYKWGHGIVDDLWTTKWTDMKSIYIPYPSSKEQQKIADYLDERCGKIDSVIENQKKIIEKLKEYKQSVITEAVTKGLAPNVPMKDSGIEWIGQIPEHWKLSKVFFFYNIQLGKMLQPIQKSDSDVERKYLCALNVGNNTFKNETNKTMWFSPEELELYSVKNGDLLVVEGGDVASSAFVNNLDEDVCFQNALHRVRPIGKNSLKYLRYLLISAKSSGYIDLICNKATIAHFSKEKFISMPYIVMSFQEQIAISEFLDEKCLKIDEAIQKKEETIEKLTEYKKSLIYECVTGKKEIVL